MSKIAVLCSGGDAPGMNAAIRAAVRRAAGLGHDTVGVRDGYRGLIAGDLVPLGVRDVSNILHRGGTILGTSRCPEFRTPEGRERAARALRDAGVTGLVVIGGDGSYRGAAALAREHGILAVGVPGTIDNDVAGTDYTIGFDTAVNTAMDAIDRLRDTAESHRRLFFVEVMGRTSGDIAAYVGVAGGADEVLVPEEPTDLMRLCRMIKAGLEAGKRSAIVIVAEGDDAGGAAEIAREVSAEIGYDSRVAILGHVQRGGRPTARDRVLASRLGAAAVEALHRGVGNVALGVRGDEIITSALGDTVARTRRMEVELAELARNLAV